MYKSLSFISRLAISAGGVGLDALSSWSRFLKSNLLNVNV